MANIVLQVGRYFGSSTVVPQTKYSQDVELAASLQQDGTPRQPPLRGFQSLATFMSSNSNSESFIFKRFDKLAARNLLYLQSELAYLQNRLEDFDSKDAQSKDREERKCARSWEDFEEMKNSSSRQRERWDLMHKIRESLREYRAQSQISSLRCAVSNMLTQKKH
jgi:hypothetical protein